MKKRFSFLSLLLVTAIAFANPIDFDKAFKESAKIEKQIKKTSFPKQTYNITDFGAKPDNETEPCHEAINQAILKCSLAGGGTVVVPQGTFYTGPITLKSNVNFHLQEGAILKFLTNQSLYFPGVITRWEGLDCYNARPLIYAYGETNIAITGKGTIDGQGSNETWWPMCGAPKYGWKEGMVAQRNGGRERLLMYGETSTPVYKRIMTPEDGLRPQLINLYACSTVLIEDVTLLNSPFWVIHPLFCESLIVRGVNIFNRGPNGDGCDPESCKNVLIENCTFDTGDDCIAIKSGRDQDGWRIGQATENVIIRNCHFARWAITIGSEMSGGVRNIYIEDCKIDSCRNGIYFKSNLDRGGYFENLNMRRIEADVCLWGVINFRTNYHGYRGGNHPTLFRNICIEDVTCNRVDSVALMANGLPEAKLYNITLRNISVKKAPKAIQMENVVNLTLDNVVVNGEKVAAP